MTEQDNLKLMSLASSLRESALLVHFTKDYSKEYHAQSRDDAIAEILKLLGKDS